MIKLNNKGFFLVETIVVVGIVATVLVLFYSQISVFYHNYERNAKYSTVESVHAARNIRIYIEQNYTATLISDLQASSTPLYDITNYGFDATGYYANLVSSLNIDYIYFTPYNINNAIINYANYNVNANFIDFLKTLRVSDDKADTYRIIIVLNNGNYSATLFTD